MKKFIYLSALIFLCLLLYSSGHAKMSAYFPIANDPQKLEIAISAATDGTNYLVPVMVPFSDIYAQFIRQDGTRGNKVTIVQNSTSGVFDAHVAYGGGKYLLIWTE
ncbi:MAG: hypothetical protein ABDH16_07850, partial [Thermodesulfovibrionaceae bacterium]